jgi:uncharacterized protein YecT (DUF1311 family)
MKGNTGAFVAGVALLISGCDQQKSPPPPVNTQTQPFGTMELLAQGSPQVCTAEDVKQTLLAMAKPDTSATKALANSGSYPFHASDVDAFADAISYDLSLETLASVDKSIKSVKCDGQISISAPAYHLQAPAPVNVTYEVRPSIEDASSFVISANAGLAKEAAQDIFAGIIQQVQQHANDAAAAKAAAGQAAFNDIAAAAPSANSSPSLSPSFDCSRVVSQVLRTVCGSPKLVALDNQLTGAYQSALAQADQSNDLQARSQLVTSERAWIAMRQQCPDAACIEAAYNDRLTELGQGQ